jgi:hypothetical protein
MGSELQAAPAPLPAPGRRPSRWKHRAGLGALVLGVYLGLAYLVLPAFWKGYARRHPALDDVPRVTHVADGMPGDPLNVALVGTEAEVKKLMVAARWYPADPLTLRSCLAIGLDTVLKRADDEAPVSNLYLFGRKQDLAFEQPVGGNPRQRHHVRFWRCDRAAADGRPVWVGSAVYDDRVGINRLTGQITHHTAADVDAERDKLFHDLEQTGDLSAVDIVDGFHQVLKGHNGGGDPWHTDGRLFLGVIAVGKLS